MFPGGPLSVGECEGRNFFAGMVCERFLTGATYKEIGSSLVFASVQSSIILRESFASGR
jgi:hypothetical protein